MSVQIPAQLIEFMAYNESNVLMGVTDVTLPEIAYMTETIKGAGLSGEMEIPAMGQLQSMTTTINWRSPVADNLSFAAPKTYHFEFWGSLETHDPLSGQMTSQQVKVIVKGIPKKLGMGNFENATMMNSSLELETIYLKISIEGREYIEADKFNSIHRVNGVDYLEKVRKDIGKG